MRLCVEEPRFESDGPDLDAILQELPERAREAAMLFYLQDRSYAGCGANFGCAYGHGEDAVIPRAEPDDCAYGGE